MMAHVLFFHIFSEKDPHLNAVEIFSVSSLNIPSLYVHSSISIKGGLSVPFL